MSRQGHYLVLDLNKHASTKTLSSNRGIQLTNGKRKNKRAQMLSALPDKNVLRNKKVPNKYSGGAKG